MTLLCLAILLNLVFSYVRVSYSTINTFHDSKKFGKPTFSIKSTNDLNYFNITERHSSTNEIFNNLYVYPTIIQSLHVKKSSKIPSIPIKNIIPFFKSFLKSTFLPEGYPHTVPPEYLTFQMWNLIQDFCSYLRGILSTQAILEGL